MPKIIPIRDLKDTAKFSKFIEQTQEPVFVTKNGYGIMVIMNLDLYEEEMTKQQKPFVSVTKKEKPKAMMVSEDKQSYNKD